MMTGKQEGPYMGEETKAEEDKVWQLWLEEMITLHCEIIRYSLKGKLGQFDKSLHPFICYLDGNHTD